MSLKVETFKLLIKYHKHISNCDISLYRLKKKLEYDNKNCNKNSDYLFLKGELRGFNTFCNLLNDVLTIELGKEEK